MTTQPLSALRMLLSRHTKRREFITLVGGAAAWPVAARAQQPRTPVVGFLGSDSPDQYVARLQAFRQGLKEAGYIDGQNLAIEYRWAQGRNDQLPALAADLVRGQLAVIVASTTPSVLALKAATRTIPIVFFIAGDPVALGLVASLNRPGGNLTGTTTLTLEVGSKWLQLLHEMVTKGTTFALLVNPSSPELAEAQSRDLRAAAANLGVQVQVVQASTDRELETAFANVAQLRASALVVSSDSFFFTRCDLLAALAARHAIPTIFGFREFPAAGGLMSYGASVTDQHRTVGVYTGRILKGEKPADLPVQQATKVELIINLKTAKALGLDVPATLLARADEVIE
jgi:putative tryptophan/tyrosine transport system substrate-binding protein